MFRALEPKCTTAYRKDGEFTTTHWSVVIEAGSAQSPDATQALERLCQAYWYPLYIFVRRQGYSPPDAQDLTQAFFARFLEKKSFALADRNRGRFRTFLLASLQNFLANEWVRERAARRGGFDRVISLDEQRAEQRYVAEPVDHATPDRLFEKGWAATLLEQVLARLRKEYAGPEKNALFEALKTFIWGEKSGMSYAEIGTQLKMSEGAVKVAVHRLRQRYRELLRDEVAQTVSSPDEVD